MFVFKIITQKHSYRATVDIVNLVTALSHYVVYG